MRSTGVNDDLQLAEHLIEACRRGAGTRHRIRSGWSCPHLSDQHAEPRKALDRIEKVIG